MKKFYYLRDFHRRPVVTVCIMTKDGNAAMGVAVCSPNDNPRKTTGKAIAEGRAKKALANRRDCDPIVRDNAWNILTNTDGFWNTRWKFNYKSQYHPVV